MFKGARCRVRSAWMHRSAELVIALVLAPAVLAAAGTGCTFLIAFDDVPVEAGVLDDASGDGFEAAVADAGEEANTDTGQTPFPPPCDPTFPVGAVDCNGQKLATCAKNPVFTSYPPAGDRANDLVVCSAGSKATCVRHCPSGCAPMPTGFPDQCDDCAGRPDGFYCGRDLRGSAPETYDVAVQCLDGGTVRGSICGTNKCASVCPRDGGPFPSCCVP